MSDIEKMGWAIRKAINAPEFEDMNLGKTISALMVNIVGQYPEDLAEAEVREHVIAILDVQLKARRKAVEIRVGLMDLKDLSEKEVNHD
jgi:hypothetical protein